METFNSIYNDNHGMILRFITNKVHDKLIAEELTNDVFIRVNKHLESYDSNISLMNTWLSNIANRIVIDHWRRKKLETNSISQVDSEGKQMFDIKTNDMNPFEILVNNETGLSVTNAIEALPEGYKKISELFFLEQKTHKEIIVELGISLNAVKIKILRARNILKDLLS